MIIYSLESNVASPKDSILDLLEIALRRNRIRLQTKDVVAVSSKIVSISEGRIRDLKYVTPGVKARKLAADYSLNPAFAQTVMDEADRVLGAVKGALLTIKNGDAVANAGVDRKNAPKDSVVLWPKDPDSSARTIRKSIRRKFGRDVAVLIVDSRVTPLRLGTLGMAIGSAGLKPVEDLRGKADLYGRRIEITFQSVADSIAAAAQLVMGEGSERRPFAIVRRAPARFVKRGGIGGARLASNQCLYMSQISKSVDG